MALQQGPSGLIPCTIDVDLHINGASLHATGVDGPLDAAGVEKCLVQAMFAHAGGLPVHGERSQL